MQIWSVKNATQDPVWAVVIGVQQRLIGYAIRHKPHQQEEKEKEDILHLRERVRVEAYY